jgi:hypothetical protein
MQVFLSHTAEDARIAHVLQTLIENCSLGRASVWFSSDTSPTGGVTPGGPWFDELVRRLTDSQAFIALLTPQSVNNLWLHYEAGCAAIKGIPILPLAAGISVNDAKQPMTLFNLQNVSTPSALKEFIMRLYRAHDIPYNEQMLETPVQLATREITGAINEQRAAAGVRDLDSDVDKIARLIDRRFIDLIDKLPNADGAPSRTPTFAVTFSVVKNGEEVDSFAIDISNDSTFKNVTDECYFNLDERVGPFRYLEQWVIRDLNLGVNLIVREVGAYMKANVIIRPGHQYEIVLLSRPYDPSDGASQSLR